MISLVAENALPLKSTDLEKNVKKGIISWLTNLINNNLIMLILENQFKSQLLKLKMKS